MLPTATRGSAVTVTAVVTATAPRRALVDVEVHGPNGAVVAQRVWDRERFEVGHPRSFVWSWAVPADAAAGVYTVKVGIFSRRWGSRWHWNDRAAAIRIDAVSPTTSTTMSTTTTTTTT